jgi:hypothetical protein
MSIFCFFNVLFSYLIIQFRYFFFAFNNIIKKTIKSQNFIKRFFLAFNN